MKDCFDSDGNGQVDLQDIVMAAAKFHNRTRRLVLLSVLALLCIFALFGVSIGADQYVIECLLFVPMDVL